MSATRFAPVRLLTSLTVVLALAATMFVMSALSPSTTKASAALVSAAKANTAADWARSRKGSPYQYGATGPNRFDCSGLTRWAYAHVGKSLPHSSAGQVRDVKRIWHRGNVRRGDLVFFTSRGSVYHVGIYAGHGEIWHASVPGTPVKRDRIWSSSVFYGRVR
ncbi:MAG: C40 family peptidase [Sporichthyaceae bacterium]